MMKTDETIAPKVERHAGSTVKRLPPGNRPNRQQRRAMKYGHVVKDRTNGQVVCETRPHRPGKDGEIR